MIRRILGAFLAGLMLFGCGLAEIDLDSMTTTEKMELFCRLRDDLREELAMPASPDVTGAGKYIVGTDIKAGRYHVTCTSSENGHTCAGSYWLYESESMYKKGKTQFTHYMDTGEDAYITLTDGMVLYIDFGTMLLESVESPSWAP